MIIKRSAASLKQPLSLMGLGTVKFGRNTGVKYPSGEGFALPTDAAISNLIDLCRDHGINVLDTAPAYGTAEERLGHILGKRRDDFFLITKTGEEFDGAQSHYIFTREHTVMSIERSLNRLKTDYLDAVLIHSSRDDLNVLKNTDVVETLLMLKDQGKIGAIGMSLYTLDAALYALPLLDILMVTYNQGDQTMAPVLTEAETLGKAILIKKALSSGHSQNVKADLQFLAQNPAITSIIIGSITPENILNNIKYLTGDVISD
jgi:aryl-alcohol dehydrogenase-like predicted oxidoreductase